MVTIESVFEGKKLLQWRIYSKEDAYIWRYPAHLFPDAHSRVSPFFSFSPTLGLFFFLLFFSSYNLSHQVCAQQINICACKPVFSSSVQHIPTRERLVLNNLKTFGFMVLFTTSVLLFADGIPSDCSDRNLTLQSYLINHNVVLELGIACLTSKAFLNTIRNLWVQRAFLLHCSAQTCNTEPYLAQYFRKNFKLLKVQLIRVYGIVSIPAGVTSRYGHFFILCRDVYHLN